MTDEVAPVSKSNEVIELIQDTLGEFVATADVTAVYGEPIKKGDTTIIPTAEVLGIMAFGLGSGEGRSPGEKKGEDEQPQPGGYGSGAGGGGGGRVFSRPVAIIVASPEGVRVEPVIDVTKIALAALTTAGFMLGMLLRMSRGYSKS